jgi:hypothetical protein
MPEGQTWWRTQREIREGKAPRRLAERLDRQAVHHSRRWSGAAYLARRLALAVSVVFLVIASTVVHSDELSYSPASGPYVSAGWGQFDPHLHSRSDFLYGGGLGVTLFQHLNLRAEYERIEVTNASGSDAFWLSPSSRF